jgi:hypothetical protein
VVYLTILDTANAAGSSNTSKTNPSVSTANSAVTKTNTAVTHKVVTIAQLAGYLSGCPTTKDGKIYYPIDRTSLHYPLYATVIQDKLKKDVKLTDNMFTMANQFPFSYKSYRDLSNLPNRTAHFTGGAQCKRCKSYGHFVQRRLQESA